jgi:hypothetical protein
MQWPTVRIGRRHHRIEQILALILFVLGTDRRVSGVFGFRRHHKIHRALLRRACGALFEFAPAFAYLEDELAFWLWCSWTKEMDQLE